MAFNGSGKSCNLWLPGVTLLSFLLALVFAVCNGSLLAFWEAQSADAPPKNAFGVDHYPALQEPYRSCPCLARHVHLSPHSDVDEEKNVVSMTVSFSVPCDRATVSVVYGPAESPDEEEKIVIAEDPLRIVNYTSSSIHDSGDLYTSDWIYHVVLEDLKADSPYWYRIQVAMKQQQDPASIEPSVTTSTARLLRSLIEPSSLSLTPEYTFVTPPRLQTPTSIALVGDIGQTYHSAQTMAHIFGDNVSLVHIVGDMSYANSKATRWTSWFDLMEPLFRSTPMTVAAGNHEIECDNRTNLPFGFYETWFHNPNRIAPADIQPIPQDYRNTLWKRECSTPSQFQGHYNYGNAFYAHRHGLVQMIVLSSYSDTTVGSVQYRWLEAQLQAVDRQKTPWLVVTFHAPLYTTFQGHTNEIESTTMREAMEPLFVQYGVNLVFSGHDHAYMRTHPMKDGRIYEQGPVYLIVGAGGNQEGHAKGYRPLKAYVAKRDLTEYGYGRLHVPNATHAHWNWVRDGRLASDFNDKRYAPDDVWFVNQVITETQ